MWINSVMRNVAALSAAAVLALGAGSVFAQAKVTGVTGATGAGKGTSGKIKASIMKVGDGVDGDGGGSITETALWDNGADDRQVGYLSTINPHVSSEVADDCWLKEGMWYDCFTVKVRMAITDGFLPLTNLYIYADCDAQPDDSIAPMVIPQDNVLVPPVLIDANPGGDLDGTDIWEITYQLNQFKPGEDLRWFSPVHTGQGFGYWLSAGNGTVQGRQAQVRAPAFGLPAWTDADDEICCGYCTDMYLLIDGKCCWRVLAQSNFDLDGLTAPILAQNAPWIRSFDDFQLADPCKEVDEYGICRIEAFFATNCDLTTIFGEIFNNVCDMPVDPDNAPYRLVPTNIVPLGMNVLSGTTSLPVYRVEFICPPDILPNARNYWFSIFSEQGFVAGKRSVWLFQQRELCNIRLNEAKYRNPTIGFDMPTGVSDPALEGAPRGHAFSVWVCKPGSTVGTNPIGPAGGTISLPDGTTVLFPPGTFDSIVPVRITITDDPAVDQLFDERAVVFSATIRTSSELCIDTGDKFPLGPITVVLPVPQSLRDQLLVTDEVRGFALNILDEVPGDPSTIIESLRLLAERAPSDAETISVTLMPYDFSNLATAGGTYKATTFVGATPTGRAAALQFGDEWLPPLDDWLSPQPEWRMPGPADLDPWGSAPVPSRFGSDSCEGSSLEKPFDGDFPVSSPHGDRTHPITGKPDFHRGVDFALPEGTALKAAAGGVIERVKIDGSAGGGYGLYIVIKHTDGSTTLYGHMKPGSAMVMQGQTVSAGDPIGLSGNSGSSTAAHLHFEYSPNGMLFSDDDSADPVPCFDPLFMGSITVGDNGPVADDAFSVSLDGVVICQTTIGATNTCGISNLRPGPAMLRITAVIAPDNAGTYGISLSDGLTFSDGSTSKSGTLPEGGSANFGIVVP